MIIPTASPTLGPLEPCVGRLEAHKAEMSRTLLTMVIWSFFMGVFLCTCVSCCLWCISARVGYSAEDGFTNAFDGQLVRERITRLRDALGGHRSAGVELAPRRSRYSRVPTSNEEAVMKKRTQTRRTTKEKSQRRPTAVIKTTDYLQDDDSDDEVAV